MRAVCVVLLAVALVLWGTVYMHTRAYGSVVIEYTGTTFNPSTIRVAKGRTVLFRNKSTHAVWPASNDHPSHTAYPEFDPRAGIDPGNSWSMKFDRVGVWRFHNHLLPTQGGVITVFGPGSSEPPLSTECATMKTPECVRSEVDTVVATQGVEAALELVAKISFNNVPGVDCHGLMHTIGQAAFEHSIHHTYPTITNATAYCGYGFFHGYVEAAFLSGSSVNESATLVKDFCSYVTGHADTVLSDACFHGVGHGSLAFALSDESLWGKPLLAIAKALEACKNIAPNDTSYSRCSSGVFMEFNTMVAEKQYGMTVDPANPFAICLAQEEKDRLDCYSQWYGIIKYLAKNDFAQSLQYSLTIKDKGMAEQSMIALAGADSDLSDSHVASKIETCTLLPTAWRWPCLEGVVLAALLNATPGAEYKTATSVCTRDSFPNDFVNECYNFLVERDEYAYKSANIPQVCAYMTRGKKPEVCK